MEYDWETSYKRCTDVGMNLITIEDEKENDYIKSYLQLAGLDSCNIFKCYEIFKRHTYTIGHINTIGFIYTEKYHTYRRQNQ